MAIGASILASGTPTSSGSSFSSSSVSPAANALVVAVMVSRFTTGPGSNIWSLSGGGFGTDWVRMSDREYTGAAPRSIGVFRCLAASPGSGVLTFTENSAAAFSGTNAHCYAIVQFTGVNTSGTFGSGAVGTVGDNGVGSGTSNPLTIPGTPATGDISFGVCAVEDGPGTFDSDPLWVTLVHVGPSAETSLRVDWDEGQDLSPTWTWVNAQNSCAVGFLVIAGAGGAGWGHLLNNERNRLVYNL